MSPLRALATSGCQSVADSLECRWLQKQRYFRWDDEILNRLVAVFVERHVDLRQPCEMSNQIERNCRLRHDVLRHHEGLMRQVKRRAFEDVLSIAV